MYKGIVVDSLDKKSLQKILEIASDDVKEVLKLYQQLSKSSISKYDTMLNAVCADGIARGMFSFYGANRTGRFAGRLIQLQNLPQNHLNNLAELKEIIKAGDLDDVKDNYNDVSNILSQLVRTAFVSSKARNLLLQTFLLLKQDFFHVLLMRNGDYRLSLTVKIFTVLRLLKCLAFQLKRMVLTGI